MKILLFNVPIAFNSWQNTEVPMGVAYIASVLRKNGHQVMIKDFEVERFIKKVIFDLVDEFRPDLAGISFRTPSFSSAKAVCSILKEKQSSLSVVLGGPHVTAFPRETLQNIGADMVVRGEGEFAMLEIIDALSGRMPLEQVEGLTYKIGGNIYHNEDRQLLSEDIINKLPWPARELLPMERYNIDVVLSSRGCPFACIYCDKVISSRKIKLRSPEDVVAEILFIKERYKKPAFYFIDEHFLANKQRAERILDLLLKAREQTGVELKWICQSRVDAIDENILKRAKEAGCYEIHYGLETGDETELTFINKRTTLKQAEEAVHIAKKCGIRIRGNFMIGFPISTHQTIRNSIRFAKKLPIDRYRFFIVSPLPNTKMWDYILEHNQLAEDFDWNHDHFLYPNLKITGLSKEDIAEYVGVAYLHTLKRDFIKEILSPVAFLKLLKIIYLIFKTKKIRGDKFSVYFSKTTNLLLEIWLLIKDYSFLRKMKFINRVINIEKTLAVKKPLERKLILSETISKDNEDQYSSYFKYVNKYSSTGKRLLDLGCGLGIVPYYFSLRGFSAYGIDISLKFMSYSKDSLDHNLKYICGSVFTLPFRDKTFDIVGSFDVIEHMPNVPEFLREGVRVLKDNGIYIIISPCILTPFTPLKAVLSSKESHSIYTNKWDAFLRIFINFYLVIKKKISKRTTFYYRKPILNELAWRRETDAVYQTSPIDLRRFLEESGLKILHYQNDGPNFLHRIVGKVFPDFASTIYIVAQKDGKN